MDPDLAEKLNRRIRRIESSSSSNNSNGMIDELDLSSSSTGYENQPSVVFNPCYEFSHQRIQKLMQTFDNYDTDKDKSVSLNELKFMMEKLGIPQTHLNLKEMIKQVDEDHDGKISFHEFLLIFRQTISKSNELDHEKSLLLYQLYAMLFEIDVAKEGVRVAKKFFEAKVAAVKEGDKFQREIREEEIQRRRIEEEKIRRKLAFQHRLALFQTT